MFYSSFFWYSALFARVFCYISSSVCGNQSVLGYKRKRAFKTCAWTLGGCAHVRRACSSPAVRGRQWQKDKGIFLRAGGTHFVSPPPLPSTTATFYVLTEGESCLARRERERRRRECGPLFSNCLYVSPDCECATAFHNGGHCLFGGESVGIFFCFDHFSKSNVWHGGGSALPVVGGGLVFCARSPQHWHRCSEGRASSPMSALINGVHTFGASQWWGCSRPHTRTSITGGSL